MSEKNCDNHNRWRSKNISFRMSPEEAAQLDAKVRLSGLTKQDYLCSRALEKEIRVIGNPRVYKALRDQLTVVLTELKRIEAVSNISDEMLELIELIAVTLHGMKGAPSE